MRCPYCETSWPDELAKNLKFCGSCGQKLPEMPASPESNKGELRFVTVLFTDVENFTTFAEDRSPDSVARLIGDLLPRQGQIIARHGGTVEKYIGDGVMATFGLPRTDSTATRNAVRAGLDLQAMMVQFCQDHNIGFHLRIGIHNGEVMFVPIEHNWTVLGDTVNTASRLQAAATPGTVWISRPVYDEVRRFFTLEVQSAIAVKGKKQEVQPYEVISERVTPLMEMPKFVGREQEWGQLQTVLQEAVEQRTLRVVALRSMAGVGKSRLIGELRDWIQREPTSYRVDVAQYDHSQRLPAHGLNLLIRNRFQLPIELDEASLLLRLRENLLAENPFVEAGREALTIEFLAFALGLLRPDFKIISMDGNGKWDGVFVEVKQWMEGQARNAPWVWVLEDVQKGDAETAAFLDWALQMKWSAPVLVLVSAREEDFLPQGHWYGPISRWVKDGLASEIRLRELPPDVLAQALVTMGAGAISETLAHRIAEHTEGNPLFATELVLFLKDRELLVESKWEKAKLPGTIREVMEARLERLGLDGREVAKRGALMGRRFTSEAVERIWDRSHDEMENGLATLLDTETVYEEASRIWGEREIVFRHGRLQEAALARIPHEERLEWLARLEEWARVKIDTLGDHWEGAGPFLLTLIARSCQEHGNFNEASLWYELLGLLHNKHHRSSEAIQSLRDALEQAGGVRWLTLHHLIANQERFSGESELALGTISDAASRPEQQGLKFDIPVHLSLKLAALNADPLARWESLEVRDAQIALDLMHADILAHLGRAAEARQSFEALHAQVIELEGKIGVRLQLQWGRSWVHFLTETLGDPQTAAEVVKELRRRIPKAALRQETERLSILYMEGLAAFRLGNYDQAQVIAEERLRIAQLRQDRREEGSAWNTLGIALDAQGLVRNAGQAYDQGLSISRAIGDRRGEAIALYNRGEAHFDLGEWQPARRCQEQYLLLSRVIGNRLAEAYAPLLLAGIASETGEYDQAEALILEAQKISEENGWRKLSALARPTLGQLHLRRGLAQSQPGLWMGAVADLRSAEDVWGYSDEAGELYFSLAMAVLLSGEPVEAQAILTRARESLPRSWLVVHAWLDLAEALVQGKPVEAAHQWFQERGYARVTTWVQLVRRIL